MPKSRTNAPSADPSTVDGISEPAAVPSHAATLVASAKKPFALSRRFKDVTSEHLGKTFTVLGMQPAKKPSGEGR